MDVAPTTLTVADYCHGLTEGSVRVNHEYQRSDDIWPVPARQFLIETVLLDYPVPKFSLHQVTNLTDKTTVRYIVDGQQRSSAILDFYNGDLALATKGNIPGADGLRYAQLPDDLKQQFLGYLLSVDLFLNATDAQVREAFRRINSHTVPLNPEEQRHAVYQGDFKWFINRTCTAYGDVFSGLGVLTENQLVRMQDAKLLSEVIHALLHGVETTNKGKLDRLYADRDTDFPEEDQVQDRISSAMAYLVGLRDLRNGPLMKPHIVYSLLLAIMHAQDPVPSLRNDVPAVTAAIARENDAIPRLTVLGQALTADVPPRNLRAFVKASSDRTNVKAQRLARIRSLYAALTV